MKSIEGKVWELIVGANEIEKYITMYDISNAYRDKDYYKLRIVSAEKPDETAVNISPVLEDVFLYYCGR